MPPKNTNSIEIGDIFKNPEFRNKQGKLRTFDRVVATAPRDSASRMGKPLCGSSRREDNPMWNQDWFTEADCDNDERRFQKLLTESGKPDHCVDKVGP